MSQRPQSASLRTPRGSDPSFNRLRNEGQATPRLPAPTTEVAPGEEEPWLFSFERCLTTMDVWKMGFSRVIVFVRARPRRGERTRMLVTRSSNTPLTNASARRVHHAGRCARHETRLGISIFSDFEIRLGNRWFLKP